MGNLAARLLTAVVAVPFLIFAINAPNPLAVWAIVIVATAIGLREWMWMTLGKSDLVERIFGVVVGTILAAVLYWWGELPMVFTLSLCAATVTTFLFFLFRYGAIETVAARMSFTVAGYLYVGLVTFLPLLKRLPGGNGWRA